MLLLFFYSILREPVHKNMYLQKEMKLKKKYRKIHRGRRRERVRKEKRAQLRNDKKYQWGISQASGTWRTLCVSSLGRMLARILTGSVFRGTSTSTQTLLLDLHALLHGPGTWTNLALELPVWGPDGSMLEAGNDKTGKPQIPAEVPECKSPDLESSKNFTDWPSIVFWLLLRNEFPVDPGYRFFNIQEPFINNKNYF